MAGKPIATVGSNHTCPMCNGTVPHVGGPIVQGEANILINNKPAATIGSMCTCVGPPDTIVQGNASVFFNGKPVASIGDMTAHGGVVISGEVNVTVSSSSPSPTASMPIDKIPFPKITIINKVLGNTKQAQENQQKIKELAEEQNKEKDEENNEEKKLPKLQGEILFVNGYLSESIGGVLDGLFDRNPDKVNEGILSRGWNVDEHNKINDDDILTADELEFINNMSKIDKETDRKLKAAKIVYPSIKFIDIKINVPISYYPVPVLLPVRSKIPIIQKDTAYIDIPKEIKTIPYFTKAEMKDTFYGYWNQLGNHNKASKIYAEYFNATGREHYINGSHGLGSNAAHRLDHGIALGYHWAKSNNWKIKTKKEVDSKKEETPEIESYSPAYKPITIVMHSQGNAPGAGVALGILKYAKEQGWDKVPLNLVYLGVHQPKNLWENKYEKFIKNKTKYYGVDENFWNGAFWSFRLKKDKKVVKFLNNLSELFDPKYHKLRNKRGIYEHLNAITDFDALKKRSVQFTFSNDRGDLVSIDGDIPKIDSACDPKRDSTLYSVEFFSKNVPATYTEKQNKKIIKVKEGGNLIIPPYAAIPRVVVVEDLSMPDGTRKEFWNNYETVATDWANSFSKFKQLSKKYKLTWKDWIVPGYNKYNEDIKPYLWHKSMLYHYGRIQEADLYAHFSPVELIHDNDILKDETFNDELGQKSIWDRIKKVGENKFYRVEYGEGKDVKNMTDEEKRGIEKEYINDPQKGQKHFIDTSIADTPYIKNVIKAYVDGDENAEKNLYKEPTHTDAEMEQLQNIFGSEATKKIKQKIIENMIMQQDNTRVVKPKIIIPKK